MRPTKVLGAAGRYLTEHPDEAMRALRNAFGLRFGVPVQAFRWLAAELLEGEGAEEIVLDTVPPGLRVAANIRLMKTPIRASAVVYVDRVHLDAEEMRVEVRLEQVTMKLLGPSQTALGALLASGALDLSKPGNLARYMPDLPPVLVEAKDNRFVLDLLKHPRLGKNAVVRRAAGLLTSLITVHGVETDDEHFDVSLRALPHGLSQAASALSRHLVRPSLRRARLLLPGAR